ncbi:MAG TPA: LysR substrate-binding domain-containing protein [Burkholderiales bacterium]|jgi:LysR family cys regulon transcriptional activator|nr:LysR substrate-binding domain-containing protein [Burkholderiales bacterium]
MKLQQLKLLCEVADRGFSISRAADALFTSQPGISRHLGVLEAELGVELLLRRGNRLTGLTPAGAQVVKHARVALDAVESIRRTGEDFRSPSSGTLTIATNHTQARYVLARVLGGFGRRYPKVEVRILQGLPGQIAQWVRSGEADVGIATRPSEELPDLALVHAYAIEHILVARPKHPLLKLKKIRLADLALHPLIGYDSSYLISRQIAEKFRAAGLTPNIVVRASDSDVIKTYAAAGLGVAIIPAGAFDAKSDRELCGKTLGDLFEPTVAYAMLRRGLPLRGYMYEFLEMLSENLSRKLIDRGIA